MGGRFRYRKAFEREFPTSREGQATFRPVAEAIVAETRVELKRTGMLNDPLARDYYDTLEVGPTGSGYGVATTSPTAHIVEFGSIYKEPDAPMRTAGRRFGRWRES